MGRLSGGERGVSELYGTLLVIGLTVVVGIFLIGTGTFVVQQLTSESTSSVGEDTMYEITREIDSIASGSTEQFSTVSLPDTDGEFKITERDEFRINITPRADYENRTNGGVPKTKTFTLGAIVYESSDGSVLSYQGGGLWEQDSDGEFTQLRSNPYLEFTGDRIRFGFVDVTNANIRGGSELSVSRRLDGDNAVAAGLAEYVENETSDKYNPAINVPANITLEITSEYADGWARYAREQLSADPVDVSMSPDNSTVTIDFGRVGEAVWDAPGRPPFEATESDNEIVYSGLSDYAYKYYNDSDSNITITHGDEPWRSFNITNITSDGSVSDLSERYELALYEDGEWLIYNPGVGWVDRTNESVDVDSIDPVESVTAGPGSGTHRFNITPPSAANLSATPICVIETRDSSDGLSVLDELDNQTEGCFDPMLGIDTTEVNVGQINYAHRFNVSIEDANINASRDYTPADPIGLKINVTNEGDEAGQMPLGVYFIPDEDWPDDLPENTLPSNLNRTILASGNTSDELSLGPGNSTIKTHSPQVTRTMAALGPEEWTAFVTTGRVVANVSESFTVEPKEANVSAESISVNETDPVEGDSVTVSVTLNETAGEGVDRVVDLKARGANSTVQIDKRAVSIPASGNTTSTFNWTVPARFAGQTIDLNASVSLTTLSRNVTATNETQVNVSTLDPNFELEFGDAAYEVPEGEAPEFNVTVENTGTDRGEAVIELADLGGDEVDQVSVALDPGNSTGVTLELPPRTEDATGTVSVDGTFIVPRTGGNIDNDTAVLTIGSEFVVADVDLPGFVSPESTVPVDVTINNTGAEGEQLVVVEAGPAGDRRVIGASELTLGDGNTTTESFDWQIGSLIAADDPEVFVTTRDDNVTKSVDVASRVEIVDYEFEETDSIEIDADNITLENTGDQIITQNLTLGFSETNETDTVSVTIDPNTTETVDNLGGGDLQLNDIPRTGTATLQTDDDTVSEQILVTRDGPDCGVVSYEGSGTSGDPYEIENVDQLQCIDDREYDGSTPVGLNDHYELVDDIDASGTENWNDGDGFVPIADQSRTGAEFSGSFDGNGNEITGLTIDRPDEPFVGLFAVTSPFDNGNAKPVGEGATIKNVRLEDVDIHGQQVTGALVAGAGGPVEDSRVSGRIEAEYQGVGGLIGHGHNADANSRLVSEATVIGGIPACATDDVSHPWGANNLGIGGIIAGTGYNTQVSTAYSRANVTGPFAVGGIAGWTSDNPSDYEQMYFAGGNITITANQSQIDDWLDNCGRSSHGTSTGGGIFGRGDSTSDSFKDSVYHNSESHSDPLGEHPEEENRDIATRTTGNMTGLFVNQPDRLGNLSFQEDGGPWTPVPGDYPRFQWELEDEGAFEVAIDETDGPVTPGTTLAVNVTVTNTNPETETQSIALYSDSEGNVQQDVESVTIEAYDPVDDLGVAPTETITLEWDVPLGADSGSRTISVESEDDADTTDVGINPFEPDFEVTNVTLENAANGTIAEGAQLNLTATITNTGDPDEQVVEAIYNGTTVDAETVALNGSEETTVGLSWQTIGVLDGTNASAETITVSTNDDSQNETVTVEPQFPELEITAPVDATDVDSQVAGTPFDATVEVTNNGTGAAISQPVRLVLERTDGSNVSYSGFDKIDSLAANDSTTLGLQTFADVDNAGEYTLKIEAGDATRTISNVLVSPINLSIVETNAPVLEGETLEITAAATNPDSTNVTVDIELLVGDGSFPLDVRTDLPIPPDGTIEPTFKWNTQFGDAGDRNATVKVSSIGGAARETVEIKVNEVNPVLNDATIRVPDSPIDIDLADLQIGEDDE